MNTVFQKSLILAFVSSILLACAANAQAPKILPGYIVRIEGDTLRGFISDLPYSGAYDSCLFKTDLDKPAQVFSPAKLKAYRCDGKNMMVSRSVDVKDKRKQVFVEIMVEGIAVLARYRFYEENYFYVEKDQSGLQPLTNETVRVEQQGVWIYRKNNKYKAVLKSLLGDCPAISSKIQHATLQQKSMTLLIEQYNRCIDPNANEEKPWSVTDFGILLGVNSSTYTKNEVFPPPPSTYVSATKFTAQYNGTGIELGSFVEFSFIRKKLGSSIRIDFVYVNTHYEASGQAHPYAYQAKMDAQQLKVPFAYKYNLNMNTISPYLVVGLSVTVPLKVQSQITMTSSNLPYNPNQYIENYAEMNPLFGFFAGFGISTPVNKEKRFFAEARYEKATGSTNYVARIGLRF